MKVLKQLLYGYQNGEWNVILTFLQWSAAVSKGKVEHQKIRKDTHVSCYVSQQKKKCDWASELRAYGYTCKTCLLYSNFISDYFIYALHSITLCTCHSI